jgi:hypothetical protein
MKVLAYGRRTRDSSAADQIVRAEAWAAAAGRGFEVVRLKDHELVRGACEYPPRAAMLEACRREVVGGVVVLDLAILGPSLATTLAEIESDGAVVLVVGGHGRRTLELRSPELLFAVEVANAATHAQRMRAGTPQRICPTRVRVDMDKVMKMQRDGLRIEDVVAALGGVASRSTIVRRLRAARADRLLKEDRERTRGHEQFRK